MTPGFAKPRSELPWLPYGVCDRVIINAHNFNPPAAFDPLSITGCRSWHDASDATTLYDAASGGSLVAANGSVLRFDDKSGNGWHLINATSAQCPLRKTSIQNSLDCVLFDGSNDRLLTASNFPETGNADFSVFVVSKKLTSGKGTLFGWGTSAVALQGAGLYDDGSTRVFGYAGSNSHVLTSIDTTTFHLLSFLKSAGAINTNSTSRKDLTSFAAGSGHSTNTPNIASGKLSMGIYSDFMSIFYHGYVGEMLIYDSKLSDADRDAVEAYLKAKWGTP